MTYESFRLLLTPNVAEPGTWSAQVLESPLAANKGKSDKLTPTFTRQELKQIRNPNLFPNKALLRSLGENVWASVMQPKIEAAFESSRVIAAARGNGLRVVFVVQGDDPSDGTGTFVRLGELPLEALFNHAYVASDLNTPISRSLVVSPSYEMRKVPLPLRLLVVVAAPTDISQAKIDEERKVIEKALAPLRAGGTLQVDFCLNATRRTFLSMVRSGYHIVHFIGHGAFDTIGDDTTPVPYVCFEREDTHESDPVDGEVLRLQMQNTDVRLVVLTACSSSAPAPPEQEPYVHRAFDGIAQTLIGGHHNSIPAVVAMQFDLDDVAAVAFSRTFYDYLLRPNVSLDEAVTQARVAVASEAKLGPGHRAWLTPTLYWNCEGVPLFEIIPVDGNNLDAATKVKVEFIDSEINALRGVLQKLAGRPAAEQPALHVVRQDLLDNVQRLEEERGQLFGDSLRMIGASARRGDVAELTLELRLRLAATIGTVDLTVSFPHDKLTFEPSPAGAAGPVIAPGAPGVLRVIVANASNNAQWGPGRYPLGMLKFRVEAAADSVTRLALSNGTVAQNGVVVPFALRDPVIFVE